MQRFSVIFMLSLMSLNATASAYLPVVDVSNGTVSARAAFGEEIAPVKKVAVEKNARKTEKKVVARSAKKTNTAKNSYASNDVLRPQRPSSNLWANNDTPLRMPRMDEIALIRSDDVLPEESLDSTIVSNSGKVVERNNDTKREIDSLRQEIARLTQMQQEVEERLVRARPVMVRTPIEGESNVKPVAKNNNVNIKREVVSFDANKDSVARSAAVAEPKFTSVSNMAKMSPNELKKAFKKTYLSENKHLSTYQIDDRYDVVSDMSSEVEGFSAQRDLSEVGDGVRPLEIKISFLNGDSGLSRENYNLLSETASIVVNNPKRAIQVAIPESATYDKDARKLAARRLAIVEQVLRDTGVAEQRIVPVLSQRDDDVFVLRVISGDLFETLTQQKRNMFGDSVSNKSYKSMSW
ncbi:MAG: hypothetical protein IJV03_02395 [Alphaproteobacteria bacterium]|nr:hypothetical protein [Alphaproteobacteria bacterium]